MGNFDPPKIEFLSDEERNNWYEQGVAFMVTDVSRNAQGKYGPNATFTMRVVNAKTGEMSSDEYMLSLTDNPRRDRITQYIIDTIAEHGACGPIVFDKVPSGKGNDAWVFKAAPEKASK